MLQGVVSLLLVRAHRICFLRVRRTYAELTGHTSEEVEYTTTGEKVEYVTIVDGAKQKYKVKQADAVRSWYNLHCAFALPDQLIVTPIPNDPSQRPYRYETRLVLPTKGVRVQEADNHRSVARPSYRWRRASGG